MNFEEMLNNTLIIKDENAITNNKQIVKDDVTMASKKYDIENMESEMVGDLDSLIKTRNDIFAKIRAIEEKYEGIENENNSKKVQMLNMEQAKLSAKKNELSKELSFIQNKLSSINNEIATISGTSREKILEAIKKQRWYFFKNKPKILMDRNTGLLWNNPEYVSYYTEKGQYFTVEKILKSIENLDIDGYGFWKIINERELEKIVKGNSGFPFYTGEYHKIGFNGGPNSKVIVRFEDREEYSSIWLDRDYPKKVDNQGIRLIYNDSLVCGTDYEVNVAQNNSVYSEEERLQYTLDLFIQNNLIPVFKDEQITELYKKIYIEKPKLVEQLHAVQVQIESLQTEELISSSFDYNVLLSKYDIKAIDNSIIKYYQAIQQWINELMEKLDYYEKEKDSVVRDFNVIGLKLSKKYENNINLTDEENSYLAERQRFFQKKFSLGVNGVKSKLLAVKKQADDLEDHIDEIDNGDDAIHALAILEQEKRASFSFIAENTAKIIHNALLKIEFFEKQHQFVLDSINIWEKWTEEYKIFKTTYKEDLKNSCEEDGIEPDIWSVWYKDWQKTRFLVEKMVQPIIERGLKNEIVTNGEEKVNVVQSIIGILENYKKSIDKFYIEERKGIYQKFAFQSGGELQDKFETESSLYRFVVEFQTSLQDIIFKCKNAEDRIFILNWANALLDIQIDEILVFVADNNLQKISQTVLQEFAELKQKNYDIYLADIKAYSEAKSQREKQYNSLIFKMRKDLMK